MNTLRVEVESLEQVLLNGRSEAHARSVVDHLLDALEAGTVRAAGSGDDGRWTVHAWVKTGILAAFRLGRIAPFEMGGFSFADVDTLPPRRFEDGSRVRLVPGGTVVRRGAYVAPGAICMPPSYVNVGAYVGADTLVDSHVLVGSCAQIGARVHLSAAVQVGGVLEPAGALPVIVEDDVFIGGGCGIYEGCIVRARAVLAPGVILSRSTPVYDLVNERVLRAEAGGPCEIPSGAVVVPGARPASGAFARTKGVSVYAPVIVKYRDVTTDTATILEQALRGHTQDSTNS